MSPLIATRVPAFDPLIDLSVRHVSAHRGRSLLPAPVGRVLLDPAHRPLAGFSYVGMHRYFLTFYTRERGCCFADAASVGQTLSQIRRTATDESFEILAYCFMPDHVHLLVEAVND